MLNGNQYWDKKIVSQMVLCNYKGRSVYTYADARQNLYSDLYMSAQRAPDKPAIVTEDGTVTTYGEFLKYVQRFSQYLHYEKKVKKGDLVASLLFNTLEFCVAFYAVAKLGGVFIPISTKCKIDEWNSMLKRLPIRLVLLEHLIKEHAECIAEQNPGLDIVISHQKGGFAPLYEGREYPEDPYFETCWEDDVIIMFTSGTTAKSKAVVLSNFNVANSVMTYEKILGITPEDKTIIATPIYHVTGLIALLGLFVHCGGTIYLQSSFKPERVLECAVKNDVTLIHASPTVFIMLLEKRKEFPGVPSLKTFACGSANIPPEVISELGAWLPNISFRTIYGLTESSSPATIFPTDAAKSEKIGSSGWPIPGMCAKIVDEKGQELPPGEAGELLLLGSVILDRYYNSNDALSPDGWFNTGDIAKYDKDGYIYIVDRKKDMINRGGEKIWSNEVENTIARMPGIAEVAVFGIPHRKYGEIPMAIVREKAKGSVDPQKVREYVLQNIAKFKAPEHVVLVDEIPKTDNGKIDKKRLRLMYLDYEAQNS